MRWQTILCHMHFTQASPGKVVLCSAACSYIALQLKIDWGTGWFSSNPAFLEVSKKGFAQVTSLVWITARWHGCSWHGCGEKTVSAAVLGYAGMNCIALIKIRSDLNSIKFKQKQGMLVMRLLQNSHVLAGWSSKDTTRNLRGTQDCLSANLICRPRAFCNCRFLWVVS